ncbi:MAG: phosphoesterase [Desulfobacter sp.]|nr:MAG: phosphoesterase [Desulfobacter sp.]
MASGGEQILCINRNTLPSAWVEKQTVLPMEITTFTEQCSRSGFAFADRAGAEEDPGRKQIIPYILLQTRDGSLTAAYTRRGSEKRLHDLWSLGIGGHINPIDSRNNDNGGPCPPFKDILITGMERELDEELIRRPKKDRPEFMGIISEDITPVGSVHLGAVFRILTETPDAYLPGDELYRFTWLPTNDLGGINMELWSELALELINRQ